VNKLDAIRDRAEGYRKDGNGSDSEPIIIAAD
jgi:hypothetical protein